MALLSPLNNSGLDHIYLENCFRVWSSPNVFLAMVIVVLPFAALSSAFCTHRKRKTIPSEPFQALLNVFAPTSSSWPSLRCLQVVKSGSSHREIKLDVLKLFEDVLSGQIDFRNPQDDLPDLLRKRLHIYGWCINLDVSLSLKIYHLYRVLVHKIHLTKVGTSILQGFL